MEGNLENFKKLVLESEVPVLVDFWAEWCMPCRMIAPYVEQIEKEYEGKIRVVSVNVDDNQELAIEYGVMSIPTLAFFKNGELVDQVVGAVPKRVIEEKVLNLIER